VADRELPYETTDPLEIDHIALLIAAKLVSGSASDFGHPGAAARIERVTPDGRAVLALLRAQQARERMSRG
jgi:hypothetical protein